PRLTSFPYTTLFRSVVRANGVNTAVTVKALSTSRELTPLMVAYPIVRSGSITEIAYYASAHPALLSSDTSSAGESYVTTTLDTADRKSTRLNSSHDQ